MLSIRKTVTLNGATMIAEAAIESYQATIDSRNPEGIGFSVWQNDAAACKLYRQECRRNYAEFQDAAYELQDKMIDESGHQEAET